MKTRQADELHGLQHRRRFAPRLLPTLAMAALGAMAFSALHAQATNSSIFGKAPTDSTITVHGETGITRHGSPNGKGRYNLSSLPPGTYTVWLEKDGKTLASLPGIALFVGRASEVDFTCDNGRCTASPGR